MEMCVGVCACVCVCGCVCVCACVCAGANPEGLLVFPEDQHFPHNNVFFLFTIAY